MDKDSNNQVRVFLHGNNSNNLLQNNPRYEHKVVKVALLYKSWPYTPPTTLYQEFCAPGLYRNKMLADRSACTKSAKMKIKDP